MGELKPPGKPFDISKWEVQDAWEKVKANKGAPGVDETTLGEFEADLKNNLYKIWNRMSSGSYLPPPVKAVEIPKPHGSGTRILGVPTGVIPWDMKRDTRNIKVKLGGPAEMPAPRSDSTARGPDAVLQAIKAVHTLAWISIEACMMYVLYAGFAGRSDRRAGIAAGVVAGEALIYAGSGFRCPLTQVAERLGAELGSVTDSYLPRWLARNLPAIHVPLIGLAGYLHARNLRTRHRPGRRVRLINDRRLRRRGRAGRSLPRAGARRVERRTRRL